jgi:hypothetical protein
MKRKDIRRGKNASKNYLLQKAAADRFNTYCKLFDFYIAAGGSLSPERDSQSPFDFNEYYLEASRTGKILRKRKKEFESIDL